MCLTDQRLEAVGHGVAQVRLSTQVGTVSVEHETIQLQLLHRDKKTARHSHTTGLINRGERDNVGERVREKERDREREVERKGECQEKGEN